MAARLNHRFALELDGTDMLLIQEVQPPDVELPIVEHGRPGNMPVGKTPGRVKIGNLSVKSCQPQVGSNLDVWRWAALAAQSPAGIYMRTGFLLELGPDEFIVVQKWFLGGVWPTKISPSGFKTSGDADNVIDSVEFAVEYYFPMGSPEWLALFGGGAVRAGGLPLSLSKK